MAGLVSAAVLAGCATEHSIQTVSWSTATLNGKKVSVESLALGEKSFELTVYSGTNLTDAQLGVIWDWKAAQLAAGRSFTKSAKIEAWNRDVGVIVGEIPSAHEPGEKMTGLVAIH